MHPSEHCHACSRCHHTCKDLGSQETNSGETSPHNGHHHTTLSDGSGDDCLGKPLTRCLTVLGDAAGTHGPGVTRGVLSAGAHRELISVALVKCQGEVYR